MAQEQLERRWRRRLQSDARFLRHKPARRYGYPTYVEVRLIGGRAVAVRRGDVVLHAAGASWSPTRARVVAEARKFLGLPYLWAGVSGVRLRLLGLHLLGLPGLRTDPVTGRRPAGCARKARYPWCTGARRSGVLPRKRQRDHRPRRHIRRQRQHDRRAQHRGADPDGADRLVPYFAGARRYLSR